MKSKSHSAKGTLISKSNLGFNEIKLMELSRYYFSCYSVNRTPDPEIAVDLCREKFGLRYAVEISMSLLQVLSAMRESRKSTFQYNSRNCQKCKTRISNCERLLFSTVQSHRLGDKQSSYITSMILCEGNETAKFLKSIDNMNKYMAMLA